MALPVGTPEYISPEVLTSLDNKMVYGACCDWWSVGIILYELLLDVTPFEGDSTVQTYANIMNYEVLIHVMCTCTHTCTTCMYMYNVVYATVCDRFSCLFLFFFLEKFNISRQ